MGPVCLLHQDRFEKPARLCGYNTLSSSRSRDCFRRNNVPYTNLWTRLHRIYVCSKGRVTWTYCLCLYNISLWKNFTVTCLNRMKSCYHKCINKLFGFARMDSMTQILIMLRLPSFDTVLHNVKSSFHKQCHNTSNCLIHYLLRLFDVSMWCLATVCFYVILSISVCIIFVSFYCVCSVMFWSLVDWF